MIDNKIASSIAEIYYENFTKYNSGGVTGYGSFHRINKEELSKYLYEQEFDDEFISLIENINLTKPKKLKKFIRELNTGTSLNGYYKKSRNAGKYFLKRLGETIIFDSEQVFNKEKVEKLKEELKKKGNIISNDDNKIVINEDIAKQEELEVDHRNNENFITKERIDTLKKIEQNEYDIRKLIRFCEELNKCFKNECYYTVSFLQRAILDHIPPIFNQKNFNGVANNHKGGTFKKHMTHLNKSSKKITDNHLHQQITNSEELINKTQIDFRPSFDALICEIINELRKIN
jgi:hypothetical protein